MVNKRLAQTIAPFICKAHHPSLLTLRCLESGLARSVASSGTMNRLQLASNHLPAAMAERATRIQFNYGSGFSGPKGWRPRKTLCLIRLDCRSHLHRSSNLPKS